MIKLFAAFTGLVSESITASKTKNPSHATSNISTTTPAQVPETSISVSTGRLQEGHVTPSEDFKKGDLSKVQASETRESASTLNPPERGVIPVGESGSEGSTDSDDDDGHFEGEDRDEAYWQLDDMQAEDPSGENEDAENNDQLASAFLRDHPLAETPNRPTGRLPLPVILPQRRPADRKRGFIRAYAPALEECGIDQETFLDFLKTFHRMSQSSPLFPLVRLASFAIFAVPLHTLGTTGVLIIQGLVSRAIEMQRRSR